MKKLIASIILTLAGVAAFAITDDQKAAFVSAVDKGVDFNDFKTSVQNTAKLDEARPMATWAQEEPLQFNGWLKGKGNQYIWTVRLAVNKDFPSESVEDAVINDFSATYDKADKSNAFYKDLKSRDFSITVDGQVLRMSDGKILSLGEKYADAEIFNYLDDGFLADKFLTCIEIIRKSDQKGDILFAACQRVERMFFAKRKTDETVKANWESFQSDANEIFMSYYKEQKLKSLNK